MRFECYAQYSETDYDFGNDIKFTLKHVGALTLWEAVALANGDDYTGLKIWSGDQLLVRHILAHQELFRGKSIVVLGSGAGLAAMVAAKVSGAVCVLTDGADDAVELLIENVKFNGLADRVTCEKMYWGKDEGSLRSKFPQGFDIVIGADLIYTQEVLDPLMKAIDTLLSPEGTSYIVYLARGSRRLGQWLLELAHDPLRFDFEYESLELTPFEEDDPESFLYTFKRPHREQRALSLPVLNSAKFIATHSEDVRVNSSGIEAAARSLLEVHKAGGFSLSGWKQHELNPKVADEKAVDWIFLVDTLNFSFYNDLGEEPYAVDYKGKTWTGYWTLCACINRALEEGIPITSASYMKDITEEQMRHIFRGKSESQLLPPLFKERLTVVRDAGAVLCEKFGGSFVNCLCQASKSSRSLLEIITSNFESYRDQIDSFCGRPVQFFKRAQILIADIWGCFEGKDLGQFDDIDSTITMFADYRVPQALVHIGALAYSDSLTQILNSGQSIPRGDRLECEIRGCSIWSVELLKREMLRIRAEESTEHSSSPINAISIDFYLWDFAKAHSEEMKHIPIHRTRCIYY